MGQSKGGESEGARRWRSELESDDTEGPLENLVTACQQLAAHFHCSPYEFFDKPSNEIWTIYEFVLKETKRQRNND